MTLLLTNDEVDQLLDMRECLEVMESAYRELGEGIGVTRTVSQVFTPTRHSEDALYSFKSMDGAAPFLDVAAIRLTSEILTWPKDEQGHARRIRIGAAPNGRFVGLVLLFSTRTCEPLAIFPDGVIQRMRVGATTGVAAKYLARPDASEIAVLGCGWQAAAQVRAIVAVRKVAQVRCFSPNGARREAFAREMQDLTGVGVVACASPQAAVKGADVVMCATNAWSPVFFPDWIEKGVHLSTIQHAELHPDVFAAADVLITHYSGRPTVIDFEPRHRAGREDREPAPRGARGHRRARAAEPARPRARTRGGTQLARAGHRLLELYRAWLSIRRGGSGALPQRLRPRHRPRPADRLVHRGCEPVICVLM